jgi:hypothetical protein
MVLSLRWGCFVFDTCFVVDLRNVGSLSMDADNLISCRSWGVSFSGGFVALQSWGRVLLEKTVDGIRIYISQYQGTQGTQG